MNFVTRGSSFCPSQNIARALICLSLSLCAMRISSLVASSSLRWDNTNSACSFRDDSVALAPLLKECGADLIDCSSGGLAVDAQVQTGPAFQTPFAERIRRETGVLTGAVGLITEAAQADEIIRSGRADLVLLAREFLRDPYWALHAARILGIDLKPPVQYSRAFPKPI